MALCDGGLMMSDTSEVLDHHMTALAAGDVDAIMSDYAEEAVLISGTNTLRGREAITQMFKAVAADPPQLHVDVRSVEGEVAYIAWHSDHVPFGTDTFVVHDGKIVCQTVAVHR
jgi:uncharacterized protein (TIGR02246 family)